MRAYQINTNTIAIADESDVQNGSGNVIVITSNKYKYKSIEYTTMIQTLPRKLSNGMVTLDNKKFKLKKAATKVLVKFLGNVREYKEYALPICETLEANHKYLHLKLPRGRYTFECDSSRIAKCCSTWLTYPNECAYTDSILSLAVAMTKRIHR